MDSFPVINMEEFDGEERGAAMGVLRDACENWGFFEVQFGSVANLCMHLVLILDLMNIFV